MRPVLALFLLPRPGTLRSFRPSHKSDCYHHDHDRTNDRAHCCSGNRLRHAPQNRVLVVVTESVFPDPRTKEVVFGGTGNGWDVLVALAFAAYATAAGAGSSSAFFSC